MRAAGIGRTSAWAGRKQGRGAGRGGAPLADQRARLLGRHGAAGGRRHVPRQRGLCQAAAQPRREEGARLRGGGRGGGPGGGPGGRRWASQREGPGSCSCSGAARLRRRSPRPRAPRRAARPWPPCALGCRACRQTGGPPAAAAAAAAARRCGAAGAAWPGWACERPQLACSCTWRPQAARQPARRALRPPGSAHPPCGTPAAAASRAPGWPPLPARPTRT
jgi:hypothetical protein